MVLIMFIWLPLYLLAALIHHFSVGDPALESLVTVLPATIVGLILAFIVPFFKRSKWSWSHVVNQGVGFNNGKKLIL